MKIVLYQCNSGHLFRGEYCPIDGWTDKRIRQVEKALQSNPDLTLSDIQALGLPEDFVSSVLIVEGVEVGELVAIKSGSYLIERDDGKCETRYF